MGLTFSSTGGGAARRDEMRERGDKFIVLAGNPNVGKSTVFNALTGMHQHTGNWAGKTVSGASGKCEYKGKTYVFADVPGMYSLFTMSAEEDDARAAICFSAPDAVVVVCDATCLERNLNLVLQISEITSNVVVAVNLMDEAKRRGITVDVERLQNILSVPVAALTARDGVGLNALLETLRTMPSAPHPRRVRYPADISRAAERVAAAIEVPLAGRLNARWLALRAIEGDEKMLADAAEYLGCDVFAAPDAAAALDHARCELEKAGYTAESLRDAIVRAIFENAEEICRAAVRTHPVSDARRLRLDRFLASRAGGGAVMLIMLAAVFFITLRGANAVSDVLFAAFARVGDLFSRALVSAGAPEFIRGAAVDGVWRVLSWVCAVMLPPMAIFFPFFTFLEDLGYLPRIAFALDGAFERCGACGKQALTMCMGFGCNAAGVSGCRIIDSPRERLVAVLTNAFVPCNGRFPLLITLISMFFSACGGIGEAAILTAVILLGAALTFLSSAALTKTLLRGEPSSMVLEMPPFRRPQIGKILVRSVFDRTVFVLGRAAAAAAPAGLIIWLAANIHVGGGTVLSAVTSFLDPVGRALGMDGVILTAFALGIPANEIVLPIIIMAYASAGTITSAGDLSILRALLTANGWTAKTAVCVMLFTLAHWPCATTLMTVKKETGSIKWTLASFAVPAVTGVLLCAAANFIFTVFGI